MPSSPCPAWLKKLPDGSLLIQVLVQPRASRDEIAGPQGDSLKIRMTAPPVDGRANKAVLSFLAKSLGLPKSSLRISKGERSRIKTIHIQGLSEEETLMRLLP